MPWNRCCRRMAVLGSLLVAGCPDDVGSVSEDGTTGGAEGATTSPATSASGSSPSTSASSSTTATSSTTMPDETTTTSGDDGSTTEIAICGNDIVEGDELCDGLDLGGQSCETQGFDSGELGCSPGCNIFDTSGCFTMTCGDGVIEGIEVCDGADLAGQDCVSQGYDDGVLGCGENCTAYDLSGCFDAVCGNGVIEGEEPCDTDALDSQDCVGLGFDSGVLGCLSDCTDFDTSGCIVCGNGVIDGDDVCDGSDFGGVSCVTLGFDYGTLSCSGDCTTVDSSDCENFEGNCCEANGSPGCNDGECVEIICADDPYCCNTDWDSICSNDAQDECGVCNLPFVCGNNVVDAILEVCDGVDTNGNECEDLGYDYGNLGCEADCSAYDESNCGDYAGDCCSANNTPGCDDDSCTADICTIDPYCCDSAWDTICEAEAEGYCSVCSGGGGDCCNDQTDEGCSDLFCVEVICGPGALDDTCCTGTWDAGCVSLAEANCDICEPTASCGNDTVDEQWEACDGTDLDGQDCVTLGFGGGVLACEDDCTDFDTSSCV